MGMDFFGFNEQNTVGDLRDFLCEGSEDAENMMKCLKKCDLKYVTYYIHHYLYQYVALLALCLYDFNDTERGDKIIGLFINENGNKNDLVKGITTKDNENNKLEGIKWEGDDFDYFDYYRNTYIEDHREMSFDDDVSLEKMYNNVGELMKQEFFEAFSEMLNDTFVKGNVKDDSIYDAVAKYAKERRKDYIAAPLNKAIEDGRKQIVFVGAPGTGKTYGVRKYVAAKLGTDVKDLKEDIKFGFVQFHSNYDYTDFVEGLKPIEKECKMSFVRMDGIFKAFCRKAAAEEHPEENKYYFVIDEINRADLSRVFGELMFSLEESYRGADNPIKTQYHLLPTYGIDGEKLENDVFANGFYIPENVIIIGTMNDIDRSVEAFDFALRRRFYWINIEAEASVNALPLLPEIKKEFLDKPDELKKLIDGANALNGEIAKNLTDAYCLGMAYFKRYKGGDLGEYFDNELEHILRAYMAGKRKDDIKTFIEKCKIAFTNPHEETTTSEKTGN